jgi:hypothetical protein
MTRLLGWALLLAAGLLSLPLAAYALDDQGTENWILPAQLGGMAVVGALLGVALPGYSRARPGVGPSSVRRTAWARPWSASCSSSCC